MLTTRRRHRRLIPLTATAALVLTAAVVPSAAAADATHAIADVQGTGALSPLVGTTVTVEGVVVGDYRTGGYAGLSIQTEGSGGAADATPGASDGIFVYLGSQAAATTVALGDLVRVTGPVSEYRTATTATGESFVTQVGATAAGAVEVLGASVAPPVPTDLPATVVGAAREQVENMLVTPMGDYLVASLHEADRFGSIWLSAGTEPLVKSTATTRPGPDATAIAAANAARRIVLDDGVNAQNPTPQPYLDPADPVRTGDVAVFGDLTMVLTEGFGLQRFQPQVPVSAASTAKVTFAERNPRPATPADVGGDLQVGAFNVLNYFTTLTSQDADARGAATPAQLAAQRAKIVAAITALGADVVALQEIENSVHFGDGTPDVALADLVSGLNDAAGSTVWAYVPTPAALVGPGATPTDVIMNAIVYRTDVVSPVGESRTQVDETVWGNAREPIAQAFAPSGGGGEFVVIANHFKSKSGSGAEPADGQGFFTADRVAQAQAVVALVDQITTETGIGDVAVLGDLNSYPQEDPIAAFADAGFVNVVAVNDPTAHTYTFNGELGSLDHALATPSFAARVTGADVWDINADEWFGYQYVGAAAAVEAGTVYRSSDHDPIVLGLSAAAAPVQVDILAINDFHGRLEANGAVAGAAVLAGAVNAYRATNPDTLFVSAGDSIGASTFTSFIQQDTPTLDALNAMGLDVTALGNHEFDQGRTDLDDRVLPGSDFPYLGANIYDRATGEPAYDDSYVTEVDGVRVGFIGAVTEDMPSLVTPAGIATLEFRPIVPEVNRVAADLTDGVEANGEADVIVLLVHEGPTTSNIADATDDSAFGQIVTGLASEIDAVFSGHTHQRFAHLVPVDGWAAGLARPVVQGGQYGEALARVSFTVDPTTGEVLANDAEIIPLAGAFPPDPDVAAIVADAVAVAKELGSVSLGSITANLNRARTAGGAENRGGESTLGNLVADVQLWATTELGTQIAFMNPGGLRANLTYASTGPTDPDGNVTFQEAATVQPFANTLVTMDLTGQQVVQVLEEQWQPAGSARPFLKLGVAGLTYTYDPTAAAGERITDVIVGDTALDLAGTYRVVVNSFLASGGDNFVTLAQGTARADSGRVDLQAFVDYFAEFTPISPDLGQRAVGVQLVDVPTDGYLPGDTVTANLSSLAFSAGETQPSEVVLSAGGVELGTFPVDPTVVDATDEVGRAVATFEVPEGTTGETLAVVVTTATGTTATFDVPLAEVAVPSCTVEYDVLRHRGTFLALVTVHNDGDQDLSRWSLTWQYEQGERVLAGLGVRARQSGPAVSVTGQGWSRDLDAGDSVSFGLIGKAPRGTGPISAVMLDGAPCTVS